MDGQVKWPMSRALVSSSWVVCGHSEAFFPLNTQHLDILPISSMSNAESDRKADGSAEDDDEPDEWCVCVASASVRLKL